MKSRGSKNSFTRERLPEPSNYYLSEGLTFITKGEWRTCLCPFHRDSNPSLRVHIKSGAFKCMACGAKGGDVLAFHMLRHGLGFVEACKQLGAWDNQAFIKLKGDYYGNKK